MKKLKISHKGRICKYPACKIILSIYNHSCYCYLHQNKLLAEDKLKTAKH